MARAEVEVHHRCDLSVCPFVCQQDFLEKDDFMKLVFSFVPIQTIFFKLPFYLIRVIFSCRAIVLTYQEHLGVTYITLNEDPCPRMLIHNKCPIPLLLKENVKGKQGTFWLHWKPLLYVLISLVVKLTIFLLHVFFLSFVSQKLQGLRCTVVLCLLTVPCTMNSITTFPVSQSASRKRCCPHCCWKTPRTTAPPTGQTP